MKKITHSIEEIDAASEYAELRSEVGVSYDEVFDAFLAGIDFQKNRYKEPEREYYGG